MEKISIADMQANAANVENLLSLLANRHRLLVLCKLSEAECSVSELQTSSGLSQSALSQHLAKLRDANIVKTRRDGQSIRYSLKSREARTLIETLCTLYKDNV